MAALIDYSKFPENYSRRKRKKRSVVFLVFFTVALFTVSGFSFLRKDNNSTAIKQDTPSVKSIVDETSELPNPKGNSITLEAIVQNQLVNSEGIYAVVIKNLKTEERYYLNEHTVLDAASLYKLFVMGTVFQKIQSGDLTQKDILSQKITVLNQKFRISSESAELTEGDITLPIQSALSRMITISDNYSALLLAEKVRLSQVALFLSQNSLTETKVGTTGESPSTTASDTALFLEKLYKKELANEEFSNEMLLLLKNQKLNSKLPKYLPKNVPISHKTGELGKLSHDAGIVTTPKGDYIIVMLTETSRPVEANEKIATISKGVYEYFMNK